MLDLQPSRTPIKGVHFSVWVVYAVVVAPKLDAKILSDPDALGNAIERVLLKSAEFHRLSKMIRRRQRQLRQLVDDEAWRMYLRIEETVNERAVVESELLVTWAFRAGTRSRQ